MVDEKRFQPDGSAKPASSKPALTVTLPNGQEVDWKIIEAMSPEDFDAWYANMADANPEDIE